MLSLGQRWLVGDHPHCRSAMHGGARLLELHRLLCMHHGVRGVTVAF
jgi:hypothetical protein